MINLLPRKEKRSIQTEERKKIILILEILGFLFLLCLILVLLSIEIYIEGQAKAENIIIEQEKREFQASEIKDLPNKIKTANKNFTDLNLFYQNQVNTMEILQELSETLPEGVYLTTFFYRKDTSEIILSGFSKTRETLYELKVNLEKKGRFENIYFPPSAWIESVDINFNLNFKLKNES